MKKVLLMLLFGVMVLGAKFAMADTKLASEQGDARLIDDVDLIFMGYANKVNDYKDMVDIRLNNGDGDWGDGYTEWGGVIDGKHTDLGVIGVYVNRPFVEYSYNGAPTSWAPTGTGNLMGAWSNMSPANFMGNPFAGVQTGGGFANAFVTPTNKVDLFWGKSSDSGNFGIGLNYGDNQSTNWPNIDTDLSVSTPHTYSYIGNQDSRVLGINIGLGFKNVGAFDELDIHGGYSYGTAQDQLARTSTPAGGPQVFDDNLRDNGIYTITLGALAQHNMDQDSNMRLFVDGTLNQFNALGSYLYSDDNDGYNATQAGNYDDELTEDFNSLLLSAGVGCNHKVNDGAAVVSSGLVVNFTSATEKASETEQFEEATPEVEILDPTQENYSQFDVLWNGSVDAKVTSWLNIRAGLAEHIFDRTSYETITNITDPPAGDTGTRTQQFNGDAFAGETQFSLGFGIHWQNWMLDTNVSAYSFEQAVGNVSPGNGILFSNPSAYAPGDIVIVSEADLKYGF